MWDLVAIFVIALVGGAVPLLVRWNDRSLHAALALSTGLFLGAVFLHLLPGLNATGHGADAPETGVGVPTIEAESNPQGDRDPTTLEEGSQDRPSEPAHHGHGHGPRHGHDHEQSHSPSEPEPPHASGHHGHAHGGDLLPWLFVLLGAMGVYLFEALFLRTHDHDDVHRHRAVGVAAMAGLSVHALTAGVSYGLAHHSLGGGHSLLVAILAHKGFETFSLANVFQLAGLRRGVIAGWIFAFACVTPLGYLLGDALADYAGGSGFVLLNALAAGTFLFVCMGELLPEVFHHREDSVLKITLLAMGVALMWALHGAGV